MRKRYFASQVTLLGILLLISSFPPNTTRILAQGVTTTRVSIASTGVQGDGKSFFTVTSNSGTSQNRISTDGRYVVFASEATNLVPNDTNGSSDIFLHDQITHETTRISVASDGSQANGFSTEPSLSPDGRYIAFASGANNLVPNDSNNSWDIFIRDRTTAQTKLVSITSNGLQGNSGSYSPSVSADGRYIVYESNATNLVPNDTNNVNDVFVFDVQTNQTTCVSVAPDGSLGDAISLSPTISSNGRYIAFASIAKNLIPNDTIGSSDVFVHDRISNKTIRVSVASNGTRGSGSAAKPSISNDGRYVIFSYFGSLVENDPNNTVDIYIHDLLTHETKRISVASTGTKANDFSDYPSISGDGRFVVFRSYASNLVDNDTNNMPDIFVHEIAIGKTTRVSVASDGSQGDKHSRESPSISIDGRYVLFASSAGNLVPNDTNNLDDIFIHDRGNSITPPPNPPSKLLGIPSSAGYIWVTGHDADHHCFDSKDGNQCNYFKSAVTFVIHKSTLPILALDHGGQVAKAINNAFGSAAPNVVTSDPRTAFASLALTSNSKPLYSAIIVASDASCGALTNGDTCSNNELTSTPDSDAINARAADITEFFIAGGGILALAGAEHRDIYYNFLPIEVTPLSVTPPVGSPQNPGAFKFADTRDTLTWQVGLGLADTDINCCSTHNSFVPLADGPLTVIEQDAAISPEPGVPGANAVTLIGQPGTISRAQEEALHEKELKDEALGIGIESAVGKLCFRCSEGVRAGWEVTAALLFAVGDFFGKLKKDPIDLSFKVIAPPIVPEIPQVTVELGFTTRQANAINALNNNLARQISLSRALLTSINRVQGARLVEDAEWEEKQLQNAQQYAGQLASLLEAEPQLLGELDGAFQAGPFSTESLTSADISETQQGIEAHGLPTRVIEVLRQMGSSDTDIIQIRQNLLNLDPVAVAAVGTGKFPQSLTDSSVIASIQRAAQGLRQFAEYHVYLPVIVR